MREEYDKLAWGLVKEELRLLGKKRPERIEKTFADLIRPPGGGYYSRGSLGETKQKLTRRKLVSQLQDKLNGFGVTSGKVRIEEDGPSTIQDSMFFWDHVLMAMTEPNNPEIAERRENYLDLKHANVTVGRKKIVADWLSSFVVVNEHTLYRMIQRGLVNREPLRYLSENIEEWLQYANTFALAHHYLGDELGHNMLIPFSGGALLAKMSFTETHVNQHGWGFHNARFVDGIKETKVEQSPYESLTSSEFNGKPGATTVYISTWIPERYFHSEQWWAKFRIEEFVKRHSEIIGFCHRAMASAGRVATGEEAKRMEATALDFGHDLNKILHDRRWAIACNW